MQFLNDKGQTRRILALAVVLPIVAAWTIVGSYVVIYGTTVVDPWDPELAGLGVAMLAGVGALAGLVLGYFLRSEQSDD